MDLITGGFSSLLASSPGWQLAIVLIDYLIKFIAIGWVPENRNPSASTAWLAVILLIPVLGLPLFLLLGSNSITGRRHRLQSEANQLIRQRTEHLPDIPHHSQVSPGLLVSHRLVRQLTAMPALTSSYCGISTEYHQSVNRMIETIDAAQRTVHVQSYIFALDDTTEPFIQALERAHNRGISVKVLVDPIGSWKYPGYRRLKKRLNSSEIPWHPMLPVSLFQLRWRRLDLRNHRKMMIVDGEIVFMGSMNLIEPEYQQPKNHEIGRQWVDTWIELRGEVALAFDAVFAVDWQSELYDAPKEQAVLTSSDLAAEEAGHEVVQVLPSGPGFSTEPNLRVFNDLIYQASERIIVCSPYFVPDESLLMAMTTAAYSGIDVELYVNEKSDQFMVGHAQRSYYTSLLESGVKILQYPAPMILHSKFMVIDNNVAVFGSSNLDMRSFGLNYEITLLTGANPIVEQLTKIAAQYREICIPLQLEQWSRRPVRQRYLDNVFRLTSALQ